MGWTVYYKAAADSPITSEEQQILDRHVSAWSDQLSEGSEGYGWEIKDDGKALSGFTKVQYSENPEGDYVQVIRACQEIEKLLPRFKFLVSDDYVNTEDTPPSDVEPE